MACKAPGGSKKKYIYYQCNSCKTYVREDKLIELLVDEITEIIQYDSIVRKHFAPLLKHKITNTNELLVKELNTLKDKIIRLKDAYLNEIISLKEYKEDKIYLESRIKDIYHKIKEEQELDQYNFTFQDIMLRMMEDWRMENLNDLLKYQQDIANTQYTINILRWELKISAPKKSVQNLVDLITYYESKLFELQTSDYYGRLLNKVIKDKNFKNIEEAEQRYISNLLRHYEEKRKVPADFYAKYIELKSKANIVWKNAKEQNNYQLFRPYLKQVIEMTKQYYRYIDSNSSNLYDVMLNHYETGMTSEVIDRLFGELKKRLLPMIPKKAKQAVFNKRYEFTNQELIDCAQFLLEYIGFDMEKGMLGIYSHGFTEKMGQNDIRIAFKHTNNPFNFVTTIIHEGGHGIFEQNISENLARYENTTIDNLYALHESQSRFYENILGRNINFWIPIYDKISEKLHLDISLDEFIRILNNPSPKVKRTESDELTYCMHIILRYEIEKAIFNDNVSLDELPNLWNQKMKDYLGIFVENDADGLMQDIHWSEGDFGYFPSYLLGTIYDGMFIKAIEKDLGSLDELLKNGRIKEITNYLIDNIYKNGGAYTSIEIINKMCNSDILVEAIVNYFEKKYS